MRSQRVNLMLIFAILLALMTSVFAKDEYIDGTLNVGKGSTQRAVINGRTGNATFSGSVTAGSFIGMASLGTFADGSASSPGMAFGSDLDNGLYRIGTNNIGMTVGGTKRWDYGTALSALTGNLTVSGTLGVTGAPTFTGLTSMNGGIALDSTIFTVADTTGVIGWVPTTTTSNAAVLNGTALTTGNLLKLIGIDATLNAGKYINIFGGTNATSVWSVGESGATVITPNVATVDALTLDGAAVSTEGDLLTIVGDSDDMTTGMLINCLGTTDHATAVFTVNAAGNVEAAGTLAVTGNATLSGNATISGTGTVTGLLSGNAGLALDTTVFTVANTTGVISWIPTTTSSSAGVFDFTLLTSGNGLKLIGVDATLAGGKYINIFGGTNATSVWSIGEGGATLITPNVNSIVPLYIDSTVTTTADMFTIKAVSATLNGGKYIKLLATATEVFSVAEGGSTLITPSAVTSYGVYVDGTVATDLYNYTSKAINATLTTGGHIQALETATDVFHVGKGGIVYALGKLTLGGGASAMDAPTGATDAAGTALAIAGGIGGAGTTTGQAGGAVSVTGGAGSTGTGAVTSGAGGAAALTGGAGFQASGATGTGGAGGAINIASGAGGAANGGAAGAAGVINLKIGGTTKFSIDADGNAAFVGTMTAPLWNTVVDADDRVVTSADYGKVIILTHATSSAVTLPANGATVGSYFYVALNGNDSLAAVISAATADTLVGKADAELDSVTFGAGHRIGAMALFWSDGSFWHVQNIGDVTMTYTT